MEPPLYSDVNRACRDMDMTKLTSLGPFARVIYEILYWSKVIDLRRSDALRVGYMNGIDGPYGKFSECFMTFRGVKMEDPKLLEDYKDKIGSMVNILGTISTSMKLSIGLEYSRYAKKYDYVPGKSVLFVFLFKNHEYQKGFRLNQKEYTPYPNDEEFILLEGLKVAVLGVEEHVRIESKDDEEDDIDYFDGRFPGQKINIIYLYSTI